jgi:hypothetical protein
MLCPNLAQRPAKPALGNGRLQRLARRVLIVLGTASTPQVMEWTCCRKRFRGRRIECHDYRAARRALTGSPFVSAGRALAVGLGCGGWATAPQRRDIATAHKLTRRIPSCC